MKKPQPERILQPASFYFVVLTIVFAFLFNLMISRRAVFAPDFVALILLFWNIYYPRRLGMGVAFLLGIIMDVHSASLLGEHALSYTLLSYIAITMHRRILMTPPHIQILQVMPIFMIARLVPFIIRIASGEPFPGMSFLIGGVVEGLLWPVMAFLLMALQHQLRYKKTKAAKKK